MIAVKVDLDGRASVADGEAGGGRCGGGGLVAVSVPAPHYNDGIVIDVRPIANNNLI